MLGLNILSNFSRLIPNLKLKPPLPLMGLHMQKMCHLPIAALYDSIEIMVDYIEVRLKEIGLLNPHQLYDMHTAPKTPEQRKNVISKHYYDA